MPSKSKKQQQAMAIAMHAPKNKLRGASKQIAKSMSKDKIRHYAETPTKNLPTRVEEIGPIQKLKNKYHGSMEKYHTNKSLYHDDIAATRDQSGHPTNALYHIEKARLQSRKANKHREKIKEGEIPQAPEELQKLIDQYDRSEIEKGMDVEQEHNGGKNLDVVKSPLDTLKIVLAHMKEDPKYYTHLKSMENKYGVDEGMKFGHLKVGDTFRLESWDEDVIFTKVNENQCTIRNNGWKYPIHELNPVIIIETKLTNLVDFKKLPIGSMFRLATDSLHGTPSDIYKKVSNTKYRDMKSNKDYNVDGSSSSVGMIMVIPEGTTSRDSFRYDKSPTNTYKAPEMKPDHFAQEDMDIDDPDPQFADKARARTEGDAEEKKLKGRNLLWDEEDQDDDEIDDEHLEEEIVRMIRAMRGIE